MRKTKAVTWKNVNQSHVNEYLLFLFSTKDYTEAKLREKLNQRFPEQQDFHEPALTRMRELGYLDERAFADRYIKSLIGQNIGVNKIKEKLYVKRFDRHVAEAAISEAFEEIDNQKQEALVWRRKWFGDDAITDRKEQQKALRRLVSKGFSFQDALSVIHNPLECDE